MEDKTKKTELARDFMWVAFIKLENVFKGVRFHSLTILMASSDHVRRRLTVCDSVYYIVFWEKMDIGNRW